MPCLIALLALSAPRIVLLVLYLASRYLHDVYHQQLWLILGFIFMPLTTLAYAWAWHTGGGTVQGIGLIAVVIAVLIDLGITGGAARSKRR